MSRCRSCEAPVRWVVIPETGRKMPLDVDPSPRGNVYLTGVTDPDGTPHARVLAAGAVAPPNELGGERDRYLSHFATCDDPERFRRR